MWLFCASRTRLRAVLGLKAEDAFWDGCAWALAVRLHPHMRVCPPPPHIHTHGVLGALGTEGAAPEDTEPVGTARARPLEALTAIPQARPARGLKLQGNNNLQKPSRPRAALSRVWVPRDVWGRVRWVPTAPRGVTRAAWFLLPDRREHISDGCSKEGNRCTFWCNLNEFHLKE